MTEEMLRPVPPSRGRQTSWRPSAPVGLLLLAGLFGVALLAPLPAAPNGSRAEVLDRVSDRLPGWEVIRADSSWEGAWTVVASCGERHVGFQLVPGHGLSPGDAWLQPGDDYSRSRLRSVSDHSQYLIWFEGERQPTLSCRAEMARQGGTPRPPRTFD